MDERAEAPGEETEPQHPDDTESMLHTHPSGDSPPGMLLRARYH
jgi:hypothetical protein